jgi:L-amino acid N-acyltransferase YncA
MSCSSDFIQFIIDQTPSLTISLCKAYRSQGIGMQLTRRMLERLRDYNNLRNSQ